MTAAQSHEFVQAAVHGRAADSPLADVTDPDATGAALALLPLLISYVAAQGS